MKIYHYSEQGEFIAEGMADPDPMSPGSWLVPANATNVEPPKEVQGRKRIFIAGGWEFKDVPAEESKEELPAPTAEEIRRGEIVAELYRIDTASTRPARAIAYAMASGGAADPADVAQLGALEAQAQSLRAELRTIA